jgi:hypothetical protein
VTRPNREQRIAARIGVVLVFLATAVPLGQVRPAGHPGPRTLILALDGIPYRVVERARDMGAFADWPPTSRLIASFPSVTNVSFSEMLQPAGIGPAPGYEFSHFDRRRNCKVNGSPFRYRRRSFAWRDEFDSIGRTLGSKLTNYTRPRKKTWKELAQAESALLASPADVVLAHVGATDALQHLRGDKATLKLMLGVDEWIVGLRRRHEERVGRPLRVVLLSDHGNTDGKIEGASGFKRRLRNAGLRVSGRLDDDRDVVATTFGVVGYGALFLDPGHADRAARAMAAHPAVAIAVWKKGPDELAVVSADGEAIVRWRGECDRREFAYEARRGDPLRLTEAAGALAADGLLDEAGFAGDRDWLRYTALAENPDAPHRLVASLTGDHLLNHATVLFSLRPGRSWGWKSAKAGSWLRGGHLEGTHGGLDRESSVGFFLPDEAARVPPDRVVRAADALTDLLVSGAGQAEVARRSAAGTGPVTAAP